MDLQDQLKNLFPDHVPSNEPEETEEVAHELYVQKETYDLQIRENEKGKRLL